MIPGAVVYCNIVQYHFVIYRQLCSINKRVTNILCIFFAMELSCFSKICHSVTTLEQIVK